MRPSLWNAYGDWKKAGGYFNFHVGIGEFWAFYPYDK
jgi:hypothetical protein